MCCTVTVGGAIGHNKPLKHRRPKWKSDVRLTEAQLQQKRDEFWDTAPAFDGRAEIWDALKASVQALESGDHPLAQAILDGAGISLPNGTVSLILQQQFLYPLVISVVLVLTKLVLIANCFRMNFYQ